MKRALVTSLFLWLPMLVLSLMHGEAYGTGVKVVFLRDIAVNVRFLIAVPIYLPVSTNKSNPGSTRPGDCLFIIFCSPD